MCDHLPGHVREEDLIADGTKGLLDAIRAFDLSRNTKFVTFSALRITGEMKDGLRKLDWVPRLVRSQAKRLEEARKDFFKNHDREPTEQELAVLLGITIEKMGAMLADTRSKVKISLDTHTDWDADSLESQPPVVEANASEEATARLLDEDREEVSRELLAGLTENERAIIISYYFDKKTMKVIGEELDLSESRVSQMHSALLPRLKERILSHKNENDTLGYLAAAFGPREALELAS
ncbi:sigma-70 family RNA polymerase sigma factor [Candidatus Uhrbacteria bacterium]|nr:sigma-70 family RNA polymerase sigma factor [Candidatus Uhrbacteria bacterium]